MQLLAVVCVDALAAALAVVIAARLPSGASPAVLHIGGLAVAGELAGLAAVPAWCLCLAVHGAYAPSLVAGTPDAQGRVLRAGVAFFVLVAVVNLMWTTNIAGRGVAVVAAVATLLTLVLRSVVARLVRHAHRRRGSPRRALVYGGRAEAAALAALIASTPDLEMEVGGVHTTVAAPAADDNGSSSAADSGQRPTDVGDPAVDDVLQLLSSTRSDVLAVAAGMPSEILSPLVWRLEGTGVDVLVAPAVTEVARHAHAVRPVGGLPLLYVEGCRLTGARLAVKHVIDRVGSALLLIVLSPVMIAAAAAVRLTSPGPALYRQSRVGQHGRAFTFLKFRTMTSAPPESLTDPAGRTGDDLQCRIHLARCNEADGLLFRVHDDPRVTRVGRLLRRYSIDELPQLWHVLRGEMSLVGPRPLAVAPDDFIGDARRRLRVKPGITGLWQVSGRRELSWEDTVRLDNWYVDRWSLVLDLKILLRTPAAVLRARGAY